MADNSRQHFFKDIDRIRFAMNAAGIGVWEMDAETSIIIWDEYCQQLFGLSGAAEIPYAQVMDAIHPADRDKVDMALQAAIRGEDRGNYDVTCRTLNEADGREGRVNFSGAAYFNEEGQATRINGVARKVNEPAYARQQAGESEERLKGVIAAAPAGIGLFIGRDLIIQNPNQTFIDIVGKGPGIEGLPLREAMPELIAEGQPFLNILDDVYTTGVPFISPASLVRIVQNGVLNDNYYNISYTPLRNAAGDIYGILDIAIDVTAQVGAQKALEETTTQMRTMIESTPFPIGVYMGREMRIRFANQNIKDVWGKGNEVEGKLYTDILPELATQEIFEQLVAVYDTGTPFHSGTRRVDIEHRGALVPYYFKYSFTPLFDTEGNVYGVMNTAADVTELETARQKLEESVQFSRSLFYNSPVAKLVYIGPDMVVREANEQMLQNLGRGDGVIGKPILEAIPELQTTRLLEQYRHMLTTGKTHHEYAAQIELTRNGKPYRGYYDYIYKALRDTEGNIYGAICTAVEVTQSVMARQRLMESEARQRAVIESAPVAISLFTGRDFIIESPNLPFIKSIGKGPDIVGKPLAEVMPELARQSFLQILEDVYDTGTPFSAAGIPGIVVKNGEQASGYYNVSLTPLFDTVGRVYAILDVTTDVTDEIRSRQELEVSAAALHNAIEMAELGTWKMDAATGAMTYSERLQDWLGVHDNILDKDASPRVHPADRERVGKAIRAALQKGGSGRYDEVYTITNAVTGQPRIIHASGQAAFDGEGNAISISGTAQDITIQRELQLALENKVQERTEELAASNEELQVTVEELAESNTALTHSNEELAQYAYVASHDLQEPLRKIQVFATMLGTSKTLDVRNGELAGKIGQAAGRMQYLIKDLLEFSKLLKSDSLVRPMDLNEVANSVIADFELSVSDKGASVEVGDLPVIQSISLQMNQLFYNLLGNALKFSRPGIAPVISIQSEAISHKDVAAWISKPLAQARYYHITFTDNGIGFETEYKEQIFEVFKRLHSRDMFPGSGIGLALCRRIAANHQGVLFAESVVGAGSTFHILLPDKQKPQEA